MKKFYSVEQPVGCNPRKSSGIYSVYFDAAAFQKAEAQFKLAAKNGMEAMGLLLGEACSFKGKKFVMVTDYVTAGNDATAVSVRFGGRAFPDLASVLWNGKTVVGWMHSHPSYGCFLSSRDVATQEGFFTEPFHVAFVLDPVRNDCKAFRVRNGRPVEVSFAVVEEK